jgi:hypothetical protein
MVSIVRQTDKTARKAGPIGQREARDTGGMSGMRRPDAALTFLGIAAAGGLVLILATDTSTLARLAAFNTLLALALSAAGSAAHRWQERRHSPTGRSTPPSLERVLGYAAAGVGIGMLLSALPTLTVFSVYLGGPSAVAAVYGIVAATPLALVAGLPIGLASGLTSACTSTRAR